MKLIKLLLRPSFLIFFAILFLFSNAFSQPNLAVGIRQLAQDPALKQGDIGILVMEVESGKVLAENQAGKLMIPASIQKVLTTASALGILGPDYTFDTYIEYDGKIDDKGVLKGNLYIRGTGDPTLGSREMEGTKNLEEVITRFRMAVQQKGIRHIEGHIIGDGTYFSTKVASPTWPWSDLGNYYASGAWGLNMHENLYYLRFRQSRQPGSIPEIVEMEPTIPGLSFKNELVSSNEGNGRGGNAYIYGAPYTYERYVRGTLLKGSGIISIKGSIPDPPLFCAQSLEKALLSVGIPCDKGAISMLDLGGDLLEKRNILYTHQSPSLTAIVKRTNMKSVNLYCESMLKAIGKKAANEGSFEAGTKAIKDYWNKQGLDTKNLFLEDGSGLSPRNALSAEFLTQLLRKAARNKNIADPLFASLPLAGKSGNLNNGKFRNSSANGKIWAKSGTMGRVRSYAGFAKLNNGKLAAFVVMANDYSGSGSSMRQKLDRFLLSLF